VSLDDILVKVHRVQILLEELSHLFHDYYLMVCRSKDVWARSSLLRLLHQRPQQRQLGPCPSGSRRGSQTGYRLGKSLVAREWGDECQC
jgi:hypothetical protein